MDKPMIGIRQADGSFYEILGDAQAGHKRLVLSAARADQHGVHIELYRSTDGSIDPSGALGAIALEDPQGLGYEDIEFRVDLDAAGHLEASAALPGQPPQTLSVDLTPFRGETKPPTLDADFPPLDLGEPEAESMTLDLPDVELPEDEAPPRTDSEILDDEAFAEAELDPLDDFGSEEPRRSDADLLGDESLSSAEVDDFSFEDPEGGTPETRGLDDFDLDAPADVDDRLDLGAAPSFDIGDLDAGFGEAAPPAIAEENPAEDWEKISLDDMESMEFLDTGAEISAPSSKPSSQASRGDDSFRMDEDEPLELGDFDSDLSDLPDFGEPAPTDKASSSTDLDTDFDQDFLPPPSLTEPSPWDADEPVASEPASRAPQAGKASQASKPAKPTRADRSAPAASGDGLDRMSLILSLAALSLLVLLILVLLFLNMVKAPQAPVIQPEVQRWKESTSLVASPHGPEVDAINLGAEPPPFVAESLMEVPSGLKTARVTLVLEAGDTVTDATRRYGEPAWVQGDLLSW